jgi:hypothetical protein
VSVTTDDQVSDRAHRYRANAVLEQIPERDRTRCHFCGAADRPLMAGHVDGREENGEPANISPTCRPCNNTIAAHFASLGIGRRTRQFNPAARGAYNALEYSGAIARLKAGSRSDVHSAIRIIQATDHAARNRFAAELGS